MRKLSLMRLEQKVSHDLVDQKGKTVVMLCYVMLCYVMAPHSLRLVVQIVWGALSVQCRIGAISLRVFAHKITTIQYRFSTF